MKIIDLEIENAGYDEILLRIESDIESRSKLSFTYVNTYVAIEASKSESLKSYLNKMSALYLDGIGMFWAGKFLTKSSRFPKRINATDLHFRILDLALKNKYHVFFLGGGIEAHIRLIKQLNNTHSDLLIGGIRERNSCLNEKTILEINSSYSDILFVGLGTPLQEKWISTYSAIVDVPIIIGVGSWIEFVAGVYPRAPLILRKYGLEWLFRLILEPRRLWKRYLIGIPIFLFLIFKQFIGNRESQSA